MAYSAITGTLSQYQKADGTLASGYYLKFYIAGTTTVLYMSIDSTGSTLIDKCQLDAAGYPINGSSARFIPHLNQKYKIVMYKNSADADADNTASADWVINNIEITQQGLTDLWNVFNGTPTQVTGTSFTVTSDQTGLFLVGTRLKLTDASTLYGTVTSSSFSTPNTTVNVLLDSGALTGSLTGVYTSQSDVTSQPISSFSIKGSEYDSIEDLLSAPLINDKIYTVKSYHGDGASPVVQYRYDSSKARNLHDGGIVIAPAAVSTFPSDWTNQTQLATWFDGSGFAGTGCFVLQFDLLMLKHYGCKADGVTVDDVPFQYAVDSGEKLIKATRGTYYLTKEIVIPSGVSIIGEGSTTIFDGLNITASSVPVLSQTGSVTSTTTLTSNVALNATTMAVTSATNMVVGNWLMVKEDVAYSWSGPWATPVRDYRSVAFFQIAAISGTTITLNEPSEVAFTTGNAVVSVLNTTTSLFKDFVILAKTTNTEYGMTVTYGEDVTFDNVTCLGGDVAALSCVTSINTRFEHISSFINASAAGALQYAIAVNTSYQTVIDDCDLYATRHAVAITGNRCTSTKVTNSRLSADDYYAADAHGCADGVLYENCDIFGGIIFGGRNCKYENCKIRYNANFSPIIGREIYGGIHKMNNCELYWSGASLPGGFSPFDFNQADAITTDTVEDCILQFTHNKIFITGGVTGFLLRARNTSIHRMNILFHNNEINYPGISAIVRYEGAATVDARYALVYDNLVFGHSSTYIPFNAGSGATGYTTAKIRTGDQFVGGAAPTTGTWNRSDIVWNGGPSAGGTVGWVCVSGGTPGTWKTFGTISA